MVAFKRDLIPGLNSIRGMLSSICGDGQFPVDARDGTPFYRRDYFGNLEVE